MPPFTDIAIQNYMSSLIFIFCALILVNFVAKEIRGILNFV